MTSINTTTLPKRTGKKTFYVIYTIAFLAAFHLALPIYIESSFMGHVLEKLTPDAIQKYIGIIYAAASFITLVFFIGISRILRKVGNFILTFLLIATEILTLCALTLSETLPPLFIVFVFIIHLVVVTIIQFDLDLFLEDFSDDTSTGTIRGMFLTATNIAFVIAPFIAGFILTDGDFWKIFLAAAILMVPTLFLTYARFSNYKDPSYDTIPLFSTLKEIWHKKNVYKIMTTSFLLNFFYSWMTIYTPLYLHNQMHISYAEILGVIMPIALLPFVLFEFILGKVADDKLGEKEILAAGFVILGISTGLLSFVTTSNIVVWAGLLFMTRVGATFVEIMSETYFYKNIDSTDTHLLSFFRLLRPFASIIAPILATVFVLFFDGRYLFLILGIIMLSGLHYSLTLQDTK